MTREEAVTHNADALLRVSREIPNIITKEAKGALVVLGTSDEGHDSVMAVTGKGKTVLALVIAAMAKSHEIDRLFRDAVRLSDILREKQKGGEQ